jgi:hypothetical protein
VENGLVNGREFLSEETYLSYSPLANQRVFILQNLAEKRAKLLLLFALFSVHNL